MYINLISNTGGILLRPPNIPMSVFEEEVAFFELGEEVLSNLRVEEGFIFEDNEVQHDDIPGGSVVIQNS